MLRRLAIAPLLLASALTAPVSAAQGDRCSGIRVPGAEYSVSACLTDLTTAGTTRTGHTDQQDWKVLGGIVQML